VQVIQYAGRVLQLAKDVFGEVMEPLFLELLEKAESNIPEHANGRRIYTKFVTPAMVGLETVGAHYAMSSLFDGYTDTRTVYAYTVEPEMYRKQEVGRTKLAVGRVRVQSEITGESMGFCFGMMHWGDHNLSGCIRPCTGEEPQQAFVDEVFDSFNRAAFPETLSLLEKSLGASAYSMRNLFKDEQRRILDIILDATLTNAEGSYRQIYETNAPLLRFLKDTGVPAPQAISAAAGYVLNAMLKRAFEADELDFENIRDLVERAYLNGIDLDATTLEIKVRRRLELMTEKLFQTPADMVLLEQVEAAANMLQIFPFEVNLRKVQNIVFLILSADYPDFLQRVGRQDKTAEEWVNRFKAIGDRLAVQVM